jgi:HlyD family secretion protein
MNLKTLFAIAIIGILAGLFSIYFYNEKVKPQSPVAINYNPYEKGIYATGIVESSQPQGSNVNIYPVVSERVTAIFVKDGQILTQGQPILAMDDSIQREIVVKDAAQIQFERASLVNVQQQLDKFNKSYTLNPKSVSRNALDDAINAVKITQQSLDVAIAQYNSDKDLLDRYVLKSPIDGIVLRVVAAVGDYISPQGTYDTNTQGMLPVVQMGVVSPDMEVRCYLDEILVPRLPDTDKIQATMFIRGENNVGIPLEFVNIQPYTIPNIQLSNEKAERVDVRVLPIIFKFKKPADMNIFAGQLVDVFIKGNQ